MGIRKAWQEIQCRYFFHAHAGYITPSQYFSELLSTVLLQILNCRVYSHVEKPLWAPNAHLLSKHFGGGSSLKEAEETALLSLSFRSVGPAVLQGFLCEECSSAERGEVPSCSWIPGSENLVSNLSDGWGEQGGRKTEEPLSEHTPSPRSSLLQLVPTLDSSTDD